MAGVIGARLMRTPNGSSAFSTAEITAGAADMTPHSPTPLTPMGLRGVGDCWWMISMCGTSDAVGTRYSARLVVSGWHASS